MGETEAAFRNAFRGCERPSPRRLRPAHVVFERARRNPLLSEVASFPPVERCGMRIAAHLGEAPAAGGNRRPSEETA
jgi:hypothetical protein